MRILVIDDDRTVCQSLKLLLGKKGYTVSIMSNPGGALEFIGEFDPEIILLDMNFTIDTSGRQGIRLLKEIKYFNSKISVILMTGWATVQLAVEGMKLGAIDFIAKPWDNRELLKSIETIHQLHHSTSDSNKKSKPSGSNIVGSSEALGEVLLLVDKVAPTNASILISGESGTGKELIAEAIHQKSKRRSENFVKVNLGGIPTSLFESELFGHLKGAFTGADSDREGRFSKANNGSIFLDEIGELDLSAQVKMLRVLQEKTFEPLGSNTPIKTDVRVISATNKNLHERSQEGKFREDLFYRINLINIHLPPLRERRSDIPQLIDSFIENLAVLYESEKPYLDEGTYTWLSGLEYKGNIRELKNIVERTFLINLGKIELTKKDFTSGHAFGKKFISGNAELNLERMEIDAIKKALALNSFSISPAARSLGITRSSLYRRMEKYGIGNESES